MRTIATGSVFGFLSVAVSWVFASAAGAAESGPLLGSDSSMDVVAVGVIATLGIGLALLARKMAAAA